MAPTNSVALVVEDEALIRMLLETDLGEHGFEVFAASNGTQAIAELEADASRFRAVITDIKLGPSPDGWEVARRARELVPDMPIVYVTGDSAHEWPANGVPNSVMIAKPFVPAQVVTAVVNLMTAVDEHRAATSPAARGTDES